MGSSTKKKKEPGRQEHLQRSVERHKFHVNKLELILRFFENEQLSSDLVLQCFCVVVFHFYADHRYQR